MNAGIMRDAVYHKSLSWRLFALWVLSIPFTRLNVIGTLSVDNILAPLLLVLWFATATLGGAGNRQLYHRTVRIEWVFALVTLYTIMRAGATILGWGGGGLVIGELWVQAKEFLYLVLPLVYIRSHSDFRKIALFLVLVAVIVSLSSFAHSIGLVNLDFARDISEGRLDAAELGRSGGLVGNYGDIAVLTAFAAIAVCCLGQEGSGRFRKLLGWKGIVYLCLLLGIIGSQSRNVVLALLVAVMVYFVMSGFRKQHGNLLFVTIILSVGVVALAVTGLFSTEIFDFVRGSGSVRGSAESRFMQYRAALPLITQYPILGPTGQARLQNMELLSHVHNIWLGTALRGGLLSSGSILLLFWLQMRGAFRQFSFGGFGCWAVLTLTGTCASLTASMFYSAQNSYVFLMLFGVLLSSICVGQTRPEPGRKHGDTAGQAGTANSLLTSPRTAAVSSDKGA